MNKNKQIALFSHKRLQGYESTEQHRQNFLLIQRLCAKIGLLEIITRNKVAQILQIADDEFVSKQTLGFWGDKINECKIHNALVNLAHIDFKKYSKFNRKDKMRNYQNEVSLKKSSWLTRYFARWETAHFTLKIFLSAMQMALLGCQIVSFLAK